MTAPRLPSARPTFLESDRALARATQPFARFLRIEAAGGILLVAATIAALVWANSPWQESYESFWSTSMRLELGSYVFEEDLAHLVNDLLMALEGRRDLSADDVRATSTLIKGSVSACDRLIESLHPWTSYVIVPIFALANAGIILSADAISSPSSVLTGVAVAQVVGKLAGVAGFSWLAVRLGPARLPEGARWGHVIGVGTVAGIGFSVSLFITGLAFDSEALQDDAKIGTLVASVVAAAVGVLVLTAVARGGASSAEASV